MAGSNLGLLEWNLDVDKEGHREYLARWLIQTSSVYDGPYTVGFTPDLPQIGSFWAFGNDVDPWAFCWPNWKLRQLQAGPGEISDLWIVDQTFTTKPLKRCQDDSIEDPLLMPAEIGGTFVNRQRAATHDRFNKAIKSSSHELFTGAITEFDEGNPTVTISINLLAHPLSTYAPMVNTLNDSTLWGLAKRKVKLSNVTFTRKVYGLCNFYYTVTYEFEINFETFDRKIVDSGTKVLKVGGNVNKPDDFKLYEDSKGGNSRVFLDGAGNILGAGADPFIITVEKYTESNMLLLGIPTVL